MASNGEGAKPTGPALMKDLFEDMGRKVESMKVSGGDEETDQKVVDEIESLCMNCHEDGVTRLLLTKIPFFREIVIMSFSCEHCNFKNSEIQSAGEIQPRGYKYTFRVDKEEDLQRQVVKTDGCVFRIEDMDLEIPPGKGQFTNIEGIVSAVRDDLASLQEARMEQMPEVGEKVAGVIRSLTDMLEGRSYPFTVSADDASGNSWIEPSPRDISGKYLKNAYDRTPSQNAALGLGDDVPEPESQHFHDDGAQAPPSTVRPEYQAHDMGEGWTADRSTNVDGDDIVENEVYTFPASCPGCTKPCATNMKMVNIPHFKQVVLMSTVCDHCGYRSNEVKTGGEVPELGRKITLAVNTPEDLARDVLKSESAALYCPELELRVEPGTLGGRFTTIEGLLTNFRKDLRAQAFGLADGDNEDEIARVGDSIAPESKRSWDQFFDQLTEAIEGRRKFTVVIEDPLASSYVQSYTAPDPDPQIQTEDYERTEEEEEHLGLLDIKTEGYEVDHEKEQQEKKKEAEAKEGAGEEKEA